MMFIFDDIYKRNTSEQAVNFDVNNFKELHFFFSSPELKAQVIFSDRLFSVHLSVYFSQYHPLENKWAKFKNIWHKSSLGDWNARLFKWRTKTLSIGR